MSFFEDTMNNVQSVGLTETPGLRMPLAHAQKGATYKVVKISGKDETKKHLSDLGFVLDTDVTVISEVQGNLVCEVKGVRVAIDHTLAQRIMVLS